MEGLRPTDGSDLHVILSSELQYVSSTRFGRSRVQKDSHVSRGFPEHFRSFSFDTVLTNLKHQGNCKSLLGGGRFGQEFHHQRVQLATCAKLCLSIRGHTERERERKFAALLQKN